MFKKNVFFLSVLCASAFIQAQGWAYYSDTATPIENEYDLAKDVMSNIKNKTQLYRDAMAEYELAKKGGDKRLESIYSEILNDNRSAGSYESSPILNKTNLEYRVVEAKILADNDKFTRLHRSSGYGGEGYAYQAAGYSSSGDLTVNGRTLLNDNVEMNNNLVVHNALDVGDGILSASKNGVAVQLKPAGAGSVEVPTNVHGIVASNGGYVAIGHSGNQIGFNTDKAEIVSASGQSRVTVSHDAAAVQGAREIHLSGGNTSVRINDDGITLNNARIHGVAPGIADTDAANVGQLRSLRGHINSVDKDLRAGVAMAMAAASLPQSYIPGKSLAALGAGNYRGQSGFAVGVSSISDNGKWIFKAHGTGDTRGNFGAGIGAGYTF